MNELEQKFFDAWNTLPRNLIPPSQADAAFKRSVVRRMLAARPLCFHSDYCTLGLREGHIQNFMNCNPGGTYYSLVIKNDTEDLEAIMRDDSKSSLESIISAVNETDVMLFRGIANWRDPSDVFQQFKTLRETHSQDHPNSSSEFAIICFATGIDDVGAEIPPHVIEICSSAFERYTLDKEK